MTIDEAIAMMHEWADYECYNEEQIQASEAFNQIAVLLEELKDYRDKNKMVVRVDVENMDSVEDKINDLSKYAESQYNKAIDDFVKSIRDIVFDYYTNEAYIKYNDLLMKAEQLKAGAV